MSSSKKINNNLLVISEYMDKLELDNCRLRNSDEILNNVIEEKDKEIERLNKEILGLNNCIIEFHSEFCNKQAEINRLNNIIKEVKEYIENNDLYEQNEDYDYEENLILGVPSDEKPRKILLDILDKENKK